MIILSAMNHRILIYNLLYSILVLMNCIKFSNGSFNIILIIADDLDLELDGMKPLTSTQKLIADQGITFSNCFTASPICCPSRASILTGRYQHNHLTVNNSINGGCNSDMWQKNFEPNTFAAHLKKEMRYTTFYAGKYLNQYGHQAAGGAAHVPLGWDWWAGLMGNSKYYNYSLSINGTERKFGNQPAEYLTDVISNLATKFIETYESISEPFLMVLAPPAPHAPFTPADRHKDKFKDVKAKRTPNFNTHPPQDKHWLVRRGPAPLPDDILLGLDEVYRSRWETLLAVDEMVSNVFQALTVNNQLERTYVIFTSDNGYHVGQFSLPIDKRQPYETDIKVPLLIRGPGITPSKISVPVSTVDIYSTILQIAGLEFPSDGIPLLESIILKERTVLVEYRGERSEGENKSDCPGDNDPNLSHCDVEMACKCEDAANNTFTCIRRISPYANDIFCIFEDTQFFIEAYKIDQDPFQMTNFGYTMKSNRRHRFRKRLKKMSVCQNATCIMAR